MNKLSWLALLLFFVSTGVAQNSDWQWAKTLTGGAFDSGKKIATDINGDIIVAGLFVDEELIVGSDTLHGSVFASDLFLIKYDPSGNVIWARSIHPSSYDLRISDIVTDATGNVYISGDTECDSILFGSMTLYNPSGNNSFIARYDSSGSIVWAKIFVSPNLAQVKSMTVDDALNLYVTGDFKDSMKLENTTLINSTITTDIFLYKIESSGTILWARKYSSVNEDKAHSICADKLNHVYLGGLSYYGLFFGTFNLTGGRPQFVVQLDTSGNGNWGITFQYPPGSKPPISIAVNSAATVYINGTFGFPYAIFGTDTFFTNGDEIFTFALDVTGQPLWVRQAGGSGYDVSTSVATDPSGNPLIAGTFSSQSWIFGSSIMHSSHYADVFIGKYNVSGTALWARNAMGFGTIFCEDIATDLSGNAYVTGAFDSTYIVFGTDTLFNNSLSSYSFFIAKLSNTTGISLQENEAGNIIYPNPSTGNFTVRKPDFEKATVVIFDAAGWELYTGTLTGYERNFSVTLSPGIYFVRINSGQKSVVQKLVIQ